MNCQRIHESFSEYYDGSLPADEATRLSTHLASCPTCQREWSAWQQFTRQLDRMADTPEPSPQMREQFYAMLQHHEQESPSRSPFASMLRHLNRFFATLLPSQPALQFALAVALLLGGVFAGREFLPKTILTTPAPDTSREIAALRAQMNSMGQLVTYSLLQQQSTSARIHAVLANMELKSPDRKILTDLVGTLVFDPSINVRLSTVEVLAQHSDDSLVRAGVLSALPRETAPLVQVVMIELLASTGDQTARPVLEKLSHDTALDTNVRDAAHRALAVLIQPAAKTANPAPSII